MWGKGFSLQNVQVKCGTAYQNLQQNPDKANALREAMLTTMKKHPKPVNWAAFTLIGEAK